MRRILVACWAFVLSIAACGSRPTSRASEVEETSDSTRSATTVDDDVGEREIREIVTSLRRLSRVEETAPFIPFVTPRSKPWLMAQRIEEIRGIFAGEVDRVDCREGRCIAWIASQGQSAKPLVFLLRAAGWQWDAIASTRYQEPDPGPSDPENRDPDPEELFRSIPGNGVLTAVLETDAGTLRCTLDERGSPNAVATFVGLAMGHRAHRDPETGEWVRRPCFDRQLLRWDPQSPGLHFSCPAGSEDIGPGFWKADEIRRGVGIDRPGRLAFDPPGPNRLGGRVLLSLGPDPEREGLVTVLGLCGPKDVLDRMVSAVAQRREVRTPSWRLERISVIREEKAAR